MRPLLLFTVLGLAAGCAHAPGGSAGGATRAADFFPLAVGNEWVWEDQSPQLQGGQRGALRTVRILDRAPDGYFRDSERGELRQAAGCIEDRVRRLLCGPIAVGTAWTSVVSVSSTEKYEVAAVGETVVTPAGRFDGCARVRAHNRAGPAELVNEISYAPGVGPVKIETFVVVDGKTSPQFKAVLRSFRKEGK